MKLTRTGTCTGHARTAQFYFSLSEWAAKAVGSRIRGSI